MSHKCELLRAAECRYFNRYWQDLFSQLQSWNIRRMNYKTAKKLEKLGML